MEKKDAVSAQSPTQQHRDTDHADKTIGTSLFAWPRAFFLFGARGLFFDKSGQQGDNPTMKTNTDIKRRTFMRIIGGTAFTFSVAPRYLAAAPGDGAEGVLVEACAFDDPGGWVLDTQCYQQMGGCFLLAHGMGEPVAHARTRFALPEGGPWQVWVRTRDWCPGDWEAPGRFKVKVDGHALAPVFGTEPGWAWQSGGQIDVAEAGPHTLELQDLTGFDGRCDAVFFTKEANPKLPGNDLVALTAWKDRVSGRSRRDIEESLFDVVIVGGGIAGCAAALAARTQGLNVALIQDRPLFGGNASEEVRVHTEGIHGKNGALLGTIDTRHWPNGDAQAREDQVKREKTMRESGAHLYPGHVAIGLGKEGDRIVSVEARDVRRGKIHRFLAPVFIDATGDGWLGYWSGAESRAGRESRHEFDEGWDRYGELWSPETPDNRVLGCSVLWNSREGDAPSTFPAVPWAMPVAKDHEAVQGEWYWEYSDNDLCQIADAERMRDHMLRAIFGSFSNAKRDPRHARFGLQWVAYVAGRRESRRLMGDYIYTMKDASENRAFPDTVVEETRDLDGHYQRKYRGSPYDFLSTAMFMKVEKYFIPFRCFYSRNIANLMMAGRCFSCSHIGLSGPRVMNTCGQMGIAVGYAAALCKKHGVRPREVGEKHIAELRALIGYEG